MRERVPTLDLSGERGAFWLLSTIDDVARVEFSGGFCFQGSSN